MNVDTNRFDACMEEQKTRARAAWSGSGDQVTDEIWFDIHQKHGATEFLGYKNNESQAIVLDVINEKNGNQIIMVNQTPFYAESGGQMGDIGTIINAKGEISQVTDTKKFLGKIHAHYVKSGKLKAGDEVTLKIDNEYRNNLRANHSATHLLHLSLRQVLGEHLTQKGSLVAANHLRFDFSHNKALSAEELTKVENLVNKMIRENSEATTQLMSTEQAIASGAMALFGEKYEEEVRVVSMGPSTELCGGTHVNRLGDIGFVKIRSESAIAAGIRRIDACCGEYACEYMNEQERKLNELASMLKTPKSELQDKVSHLIKDKKRLEDGLTEAKKKLLLADPDFNTTKIGKVTLIEKFTVDVEVKDLRNFVDHMRQNTMSSVVVAASKFEGKTSLIIGIHADLLSELDSAELTREANELAGGKGGGGRKELAQAGGLDFGKIDKISKYIKDILAAKFAS